ncbi:HamA C-terminal domain-containing protein [Ekhidna sp. To15]|uniref:HamA C-terminal domain-containing protein n=1 Tax=Ekhidna sp. To15 TaxID=3395267 RepID=UPI003F526C86
MQNATALELDLEILNDLIEKLVRTSLFDISSVLKEVTIYDQVDGTEALSHFYHVELDGNGRPRTKDFIEYIATRVVDYSIPRSEIEEARSSTSTGSLLALQRKAISLFTHLKNTGEGGEILLYILAEEILKIPQLICKMPLKTSSQMHYHGVDGIHGEYDPVTNQLALYWGESKLHANVSSGVKACFESIKDYLLSPHSSTSTQERDIQLISANLDLSDTQLVEALLTYFDKGNPNFNKVNYRGLCMVGFDSENYPDKPNHMTSQELTKLIKKEVSTFKELIKTEIEEHDHLNTYHIHIFMIPFTSVAEFRSELLKALGIK